MEKKLTTFFIILSNLHVKMKNVLIALVLMLLTYYSGTSAYCSIVVNQGVNVDYPLLPVGKNR